MKNLFGTDGIRITVGHSPLTHHELPKLGIALATWAQQTYGNTPRILLAHDTRQSCAWVKSSLLSGLLLSPIDIVDARVLTSPAVCQLLQYSTDYDCGIIISASHNNWQDNGLKLVDAHTGKISTANEQRITELFLQKKHTIDYTHLGKHTVFSDTSPHYLHNIAPFFDPNFLRNVTVVLDCAHGATSEIAPFIFEHFGAKVIALNTTPNGININKQCGALHPQMAQKAVIKHNATIGFAFDGDGDRVITISNGGHIKSGDDMLALLCHHPNYSTTSTIVGTIMSNKGFEEYLKGHGKQLYRAQVGDKNVSQELIQQNLLLGGEPSGHVITRDYLQTGDGIFNALRIVQAIQKSGNWQLRTFTKYPQVTANIPVAKKAALDTEPFASIISESEAQLPKGRMIIRYSGTEPLLRIMIEDQHFEHAQAVCSHLALQLQKQLRT